MRKIRRTARSCPFREPIAPPWHLAVDYKWCPANGVVQGAVREVRMMDGSWLDQLARTMGGATDRRAALKLLVASLAALTPQRATRVASANDPTAAAPNRCKKVAIRCSSQAQNVCARNFAGPAQRACTRAFQNCCQKAAKCEFAAAKRCIRNVVR